MKLKDPTPSHTPPGGSPLLDQQPQVVKNGEWFKLQKGNDWGREYYSREPLGAAGTASVYRSYHLRQGERVQVRLPNGVEREGLICMRKSQQQVSDHGHAYSVTSELPFVQFDDGTEVSLLIAELRYDWARDGAIPCTCDGSHFPDCPVAIAKNS